ncbi:hypothetical protein LINPERPRIM_LOCUS10950 [Linum perenne]
MQNFEEKETVCFWYQGRIRSVPDKQKDGWWEPYTFCN